MESVIGEAAWREAWELWLAGLRAENTRKAYQLAWRLLREHSGKQAWEIHKTDVARWMNDMREAGLAGQTMAQRLAAISSFYSYAGRVYTVVNADGEEIPLASSNPAKSIPRPKRQMWAHAHFLTAEEAQALLAAIDRETTIGSRDFALILTYLLTGRRNSEIRNLRWCDLEKRNRKIWYTWSGKGKEAQVFEMPQAAYDAICAYLTQAKRLETIKPEHFIFTAVSAETFDRPIGSREAGRLLKKHARAAGLDAQRIHVHSLRHTAAMLRMWAGDRVDEISSFLAHNGITVTSIYLHKLHGRVDRSSAKVQKLLGV